MGRLPTVRMTNADGNVAVVGVNDTSEWMKNGYKVDAAPVERAPEKGSEDDAKDPALSATPPDGTTTPDADVSG